MAKLGFRTFQEMVGRTDKLKFCPDPSNYKANMLDFKSILTNAREINPKASIVGRTVPQNFELEKRLVRQKWFIHLFNFKNDGTGFNKY